MRRLAAIAALLATLVVVAPAAAQDPPDRHYWGVDEYTRCQRDAYTKDLVLWTQRNIVCLDGLVFDLTDGGQMRRVPYCIVAVAGATIKTGYTALLEQHWRCSESYLGTDLDGDGHVGG